MESEQLESRLIEYIDGSLSPSQRIEIERELAANPEARLLLAQLEEVLNTIRSSGELEPGKRLRENFEWILRAEMTATSGNRGKQVFFNPVFLRAAAAIALVMTGVGIGYWINQNQQREKELAEIRKEVESTKKVMIAMLDNQESASQRMLGATVAFKMDKADDQIVNALAKTLNEDPNTNVRLAALEALGKFRQQEHVRKALIGSLATQKDPIIQIALIRLMVEMKEKDAMKEFQRMSTDEDLIPAVKDEAHAGILKLS